MRRGRAGLALAGPALLWTAAFFLVPLAVMAVQSLGQRVGGRAVPGWTIANYARFVEKPYFWEALLNSLEVTALVTVLSVLLAYPLAWIIAFRVPARWQRVALLLAILPFWTSYLVRSYSWLLVLSPEGVVPSALRVVGLDLGRAAGQQPDRHGDRLRPLLHHAADAHDLREPRPDPRQLPAGRRRSRRLALADLPARDPAAQRARASSVGAFLTFVLTIGDYITPQILGGNRELLLPQAIMLQIGRQADFPMAAALSLILMAVVTLAYLACARWLRLERA